VQDRQKLSTTSSSSDFVLLLKLSIKEDGYVSLQHSADRCDLAYAILKMNNGSLIPDWTGFNTLLSGDKIQAFQESDIFQ
jgi:hypothetical protein